MITKQELIDILKPYEIDVISYHKRGDRLFAWLQSRHRINGEWWEDVVRKHFPIAYSTTGCSTSARNGEKGEKFKMRLI